MGSEEADKRFEIARQQAERQRQASEFLNSLTKNDELVKPIYNPEAYVMREKYMSAANRGELQRTKCTHPFVLLRQFVDDDPAVARNGKPINLFECGACHMPLWLVDPWGVPVTDD